MLEHINERVLTPVIPLPQPQPVVHKIEGWRLDPRYDLLTPSQAALLAADLMAGGTVTLTRAEALALTRARPRHLRTARALAPTLSRSERIDIECGVETFASILRNRQAAAAKTPVA
jgi:hypothetical protein